MPVKKISRIEKNFIENENDEKNQLKVQLVTLRIPEELLYKIDIKVRSRPLKTSRNTWILETLYNALRDSNSIST